MTFVKLKNIYDVDCHINPQLIERIDAHAHGSLIYFNGQCFAVKQSPEVVIALCNATIESNKESESDYT